MSKLIISIPEELVKKMEDYPEVNWSSIASRAIENYLKNLKYQEGPIFCQELEMLSERSLKEFLEKEPDIYTDEDLIKRYK